MRISDWSSDGCSSDLKGRIQDGAFSTTDLSTGQRKRLALLNAWLEERPVLVFDEWAADQDPVFRRIFYTELLPELKALGKTIIVISHDDRYFDIADQLIRMQAGQVISEKRSEEHTSELQSLMRSSYAVFCLKQKT